MFLTDSLCGNSKSKKHGLAGRMKSTNFFIAFSLNIIEFWKAGVFFQVSLFFFFNKSVTIYKKA